MSNAIDPVMLQRFKDQLLIVLVQRAGGHVRIPVAEVDGTGQSMMTMEVEGTDFVLKAGRKQ